ncbi:hypothetical protein MHTCC0001_01150 [Flavobacteriaceae bacterium MHTCC 0001]
MFKLDNGDKDYPVNIYIENDSIKFNYHAFDHWHKFPLKIENQHFKFNNWEIDTDIIDDTLAIKDINYIRDTNDSIFNWWYNKPITQIELPKIASKHFKHNIINSNTPKNYILFGKRLDNGEYSLQLNDNYAEINDLPSFLAYEKASLREELTFLYTTVFIIDSSTPIKYVEDIFYQLKKINQLKIILLNNLELEYNKNIGLYYNDIGLNRRLPYFTKNDNYIPKVSKNPIMPPPPPSPYFPIFDNKNLLTKFIYLKKDRLYFRNNIISTSELKSLTRQWIKNKNAIFSLYDLESTYGKFLEMNAIINTEYQNERNNLAKTKFNVTLDNLNQEELTSIKLEIPQYHVWSFSIPHYNYIVKQNADFFGLKVPKIE